VTATDLCSWPLCLRCLPWQCWAFFLAPCCKPRSSTAHVTRFKTMCCQPQCCTPQTPITLSWWSCPIEHRTLVCRAHCWSPRTRTLTRTLTFTRDDYGATDSTTVQLPGGIQEGLSPLPHCLPCLRGLKVCSGIGSQDSGLPLDRRPGRV